MSEEKERFHKEIKETIRCRRMLHRHPEPGWLCFFSTVCVADLLTRCGYQVRVGREILADTPLVDPPVEADVTAALKQGRAWFLQERERGMLFPDFPYEGHSSLALQHDLRNDNSRTSDLHLCRDAGDLWDALTQRMDRESGVLAIMEPANGDYSKTILFRFDMDALPVQEAQQSDRLPVKEHFMSCVDGVSHACGHDGHTAAGIGLAHHFAAGKYADRFHLRLIFLFQPAEEGVRGAAVFAKRLPDLIPGKIDDMIGCHIGFTKPDTFVAGAGGFLETTKLDVRFTGKSAHAGLAPQDGRNALLAAASAVTAMYKFKRPDQGTALLNVGTMHAGETRNSIPARAFLQMETRGSNRALNDYMKSHAVSCIMREAEQYGVRAEIIPAGESCSADSSPKLTQRVLESAEAMRLYAHCRDHQIFGASEDAAVLMDMVQRQGGEAVYLLFGAEPGIKNHDPAFDFDESVLEKMIRILSAITERINFTN